MSVDAWLKEATKKLEAADIATARLDCLVLLEDCLNKNRTHILANPHLLIDDEQLEWLELRIARRATHEPLAYIRGKTEFYGRDFFVDKRVLEPRPESETMVELLKSFAMQRHPKFDLGSSQKKSAEGAAYLLDSRLRGNDVLRIIDVGTGSGALAITAKLEIPRAEVMAIDIDNDCLSVAERNAKTLDAGIAFRQGDLLQPLLATDHGQRTTILLANLPYVPDGFHINPAAEAEPRLAIFGGKDGLDLYRRLFTQIGDSSQRPQTILTEAMPPQHEALADIAAKSGFGLTRTDDFVQQFEESV